MKNFIVEEYGVFVEEKGVKRQYIIRKHENDKVDVFLVSAKDKKEVNIKNVENDIERGLLDKYYKKIQSARLKYATKYLYSLSERKLDITLKEYGDVKAVESITTEDATYKVIRRFFNAKGKMYKKMFTF